MRKLAIPLLCAWLILAGATTFAQSDPDTDAPEPTVDEPAPSGPVLAPSDAAPVLCEPEHAGLRYVELRGSGFDPWARQRLAGVLLDAGGRAQANWNSIFVAADGQLRVEVNLCADRSSGRGALPVGTYAVQVSSPDGAPLASTSFEVSGPPEPAAEASPEGADTSAAPPEATPRPPAAAPAAAALDARAPANTPTPFPTLALPTMIEFTPTPTATPRIGPGSKAQPYIVGAPGRLSDGWQLVVTGLSPDAWQGIHDALPSARPPASDERDVEVRVQVTSTSDELRGFSPTRLALLTPNGTLYDQFDHSCGAIPDPVALDLVGNGGVVRGNVCFTIRASDVPNLVLVDNQGLEADRAYFAIR